MGKLVISNVALPLSLSMGEEVGVSLIEPTLAAPSHDQQL